MRSGWWSIPVTLVLVLASAAPAWAGSSGPALSGATPTVMCKGDLALVVGGPDGESHSAIFDPPGVPTPVHGGGGSDTIAGTDSNSFDEFDLPSDVGDVLCGGDGPDTIAGGRGDDVLIGGDGRDTLHGGPGRDLCLQGEVQSGCETNLAKQDRAALLEILRALEASRKANLDELTVIHEPPWPFFEGGFAEVDLAELHAKDPKLTFLAGDAESATGNGYAISSEHPGYGFTGFAFAKRSPTGRCFVTAGGADVGELSSFHECSGEAAISSGTGGGTAYYTRSLVRSMTEANLNSAWKVARRWRAETGSFEGLGILRLAEGEPTSVYVGPGVASTGPSIIRVGPMSGDVLLLRALDMMSGEVLCVASVGGSTTRGVVDASTPAECTGGW